MFYLIYLLQTVLPKRRKLLLLLFRGIADAQTHAHSHKQENCKDEGISGESDSEVFIRTIILSSPTPLNKELN